MTHAERISRCIHHAAVTDEIIERYARRRPADDPSQMGLFGTGGNPSWKPEEHPRDKETGEFVEKATAASWGETERETAGRSAPIADPTEGAMALAPVDEPKPEPDTPKPEPKATPGGPYSLAEHSDVWKRLRTGDITADELRSKFARAVEHSDALKTELASKSMAQLAAMSPMLAYRYKKKGQLVDAIHGGLLDVFHIGDSIAYDPMRETLRDAVKRSVDSVTDEQIKSAAAERQKRVDARRKAITNPETAAEFGELVAAKGEAALTPEQRAKWDDIQANARRDRDRKPTTVAKVETAPSDLKITVKEGFHEKRGTPVYIAQLSGRVDRAVYDDLNKKAKALGGWFSSFKKGSEGFQFLNRESAEKFSKILEGNVDRSEELTSRADRDSASAADRIRQTADGLKSRAEDALGADRQVNTARRAAFAGHAIEQAEGDKAFAETMHRVADAIEKGDAGHLRGVKAKTHIETLDRAINSAKWDRHRAAGTSYDKHKDIPTEPADVEHAKYPWPSVHKDILKSIVADVQKKPGGALLAGRLAKRLRSLGESDWQVKFTTARDIEDFDKLQGLAHRHGLRDRAMLEDGGAAYKRLQAMDIKSEPELRAALRQYLPLRKKAAGIDPVKAKELGLAGRKIDGFFPTPAGIVSQMLDKADIRKGHRVLEPSAGKGDIADRVRDRHPDSEIHAIEPHSDLREILEAKGHKLAGDDFLAHRGEYDRIVMNPPFEAGADIDHVRHAFEQLKPGGRMVAVMSEGPFFRSDAKAAGFRDWLSDRGGEHEELPDGAFAGDDAFRKTGVKTRLVTIDKGGEQRYSSRVARLVRAAAVTDELLARPRLTAYAGATGRN